MIHVLLALHGQCPDVYPSSVGRAGLHPGRLSINPCFCAAQIPPTPKPELQPCCDPMSSVGRSPLRCLRVSANKLHPMNFQRSRVSIQLRCAKGSRGAFALQAWPRAILCIDKVPNTAVGPIGIAVGPKSTRWLETRGGSWALSCDVLTGPIWIKHPSPPQQRLKCREDDRDHFKAYIQSQPSFRVNASWGHP